MSLAMPGPAYLPRLSNSGPVLLMTSQLPGCPKASASHCKRVSAPSSLMSLTMVTGPQGVSATSRSANGCCKGASSGRPFSRFQTSRATVDLPSPACPVNTTTRSPPSRKTDNTAFTIGKKGSYNGAK